MTMATVTLQSTMKNMKRTGESQVQS